MKKINQNRVKSIIRETIDSYLKQNINENYHGELYHYTSLIQASWIVDDDCIRANVTSSEENLNNYRPCISFTRDKTYNIQSYNKGTSVCFVFDGDMIQNLRYARLRPFAFDGKGEAEERLYGLNIYPLHKYLKRIEINVSNKDFSWASDRDFDEEGELYDEFRKRFPNLDDSEISNKITDFLVNKIANNKLFHDKVFIKKL